MSDNKRLLDCEDANRITSEFYETLSGLDPCNAEWQSFVKAGISSSSCILQILSYREIGKTGDPQWLELLSARSRVETNATVLSSIYDAIVALGGLATFSEREAMFDTPDAARRSAALIVTFSMEPHDAIRLLLKLLKCDPEPFLRLEAARRLAYLGSDAGLHELLCSVEMQEFHERIETVCALCALNHSAGIYALHSHLHEEPGLSLLERTNLLFAVQRLLTHLGIDDIRRDAAAANPFASIFTKAMEWVEDQIAVERMSEPEDREA